MRACLQGYEPLDPWLDGVLRFGGGYSNMLGATSNVSSFHPEQREDVFNDIRNYAKAVADINANSSGTDTCVFIPKPAQGVGCKYVPCLVSSLRILHIHSLKSSLHNTLHLGQLQTG